MRFSGFPAIKFIGLFVLIFGISTYSYSLANTDAKPTIETKTTVEKTTVEKSTVEKSAVEKITAEKLAPEDIQNKTVVEIVKELSKHHYRQQEFNDALSSRFLDEYLKTLDNSRTFFLASDIAEFEKYRTSFDDDFKAGKLDKTFAIYNRFSERFTARMNDNIALLDNKDTKFDFETEETFNTDRKNEPWSADKAAADKLWKQHIKASLISSILSGKTLDEAKTQLRKRYVTQLRYWKQQSNEDAFSVMMNSLTMLFDPHTNYLSPENSQDFNTAMSHKFNGIGAELQIDQSDEDYTKVVRLIPGSPAEKQGDLKPNDKIVGVAQGEKGEFEDIIGWRLSDVVKKIKGPKGTVVKLDVISSDPTVTQHKIIPIKRDTVETKDQVAKKTTFKITNGGTTYVIGVIDVPAFYMDFDAYNRQDPNFTSTSRDVRNLIADLKKENVDGIIIDLRDNGGGSLPEAGWLTNLFIDPGPVVQIRTADNRVSRDQATNLAVYRGPLVVLTNRFSASASEIFAGAIQDYGRGLIVGSNTWGKGTVQTLINIDRGEGDLKLTAQKFYRVSGDSTQHRGVVPDIELPSLINTKDLGESSQDNALPWDQIHSAPHDIYFNIPSMVPALNTTHQERMKTDPDLVFLKQQAALYDELNNKKIVSLKLSARQQEQQQIEQRTLSYENQKRKAKGMPVYANYAEYKEKELKKDDAKAAEERAKKEIDPQKDPYLMETGKILGDYIRLLNNQDEPKVANH